MTRCTICNRFERCTRHHLIPRKVHSRLRRAGTHDREQLNTTVDCCPPCHKTIHHLFSEKELAERYYTVELLLENSGLRKWKNWIRTKPAGFRPRIRRPS